MVRLFCDICKIEITNQEMGTLVFIERNKGTIITVHQLEDAKFIKKEYQLCNKCVEKVKKVLEI